MPYAPFTEHLSLNNLPERKLPNRLSQCFSNTYFICTKTKNQHQYDNRC